MGGISHTSNGTNPPNGESRADCRKKEHHDAFLRHRLTYHLAGAVRQVGKLDEGSLGSGLVCLA